MALLERHAEQDRVMLLRISAGALNVLQQTSLPAGGACCYADEIGTLSRSAARRGRELRSLARAERDLGSEPLGMLLEAKAADSDKDARLLENLASYLARPDFPFSAPVGETARGQANPVG